LLEHNGFGLDTWQSGTPNVTGGRENVSRAAKKVTFLLNIIDALAS
jgi:hypothetical protein